MKQIDIVLHSPLRRSGLFLQVIALLLSAGAVEIAAQTQQRVSSETVTASPPSFIRNDGQWNPTAKFLLRAPGLDLWITANGVVYDVNRIERISTKAGRNGARLTSRDEEEMPDMTLSAELRVRRAPVFITFEGARNDALSAGSDQREEYHNYFIGNDRSRWATDVPLFGAVRTQGLYDGIDALFYLEEGRPRYDLVVSPGADPSRIAMRVEGATSVRAQGSGELVIATALGTIEQRGLFAYQEIDGKRQRVPCAFVVGRGGRVRFDVGRYDRTRPLVIDPLVYSTYLGGSMNDNPQGITIDVDRNVYITGKTVSPDFPVLGAPQPTLVGGGDAFITKLTRGGARTYSTYLGGDGSSDDGMGIAVDNSGSAYLCGSTNSTNFPTVNALQPTNGGGTDAFITKLTGSGALSWSTYLGGTENDFSHDIALDDVNAAYVVGITYSTNFRTLNAMQTSSNGNVEGFITKLASSGVLSYSTYLGGSNSDYIKGISIDGGRNINVMGFTFSTDFPLRTPAQGTNAGGFDLFVSRLTSAGTLSWSTYLGGNNVDIGEAIATDAAGNVYVTGYTLSPNYPLLQATQTSKAGLEDAILTKLRSNGTLELSTYLGGSGSDYGRDIKVDRSGRIHILGRTSSANFAAINPIQDTLAGTHDAFVMKLAGGGAIIYSTYLGGSSIEDASAIAVDGRNSAYIVGTTSSTNFPTLNASQASSGGFKDGFVARLSDRPIIDVIEPAPGTTLCAGTTRAVTWISGGVSTVAIDISSNGGVNWTSVVTGRPATPGSYSWEIPSNRAPGTNYRIRVRDVDNATTADTTTASFTINAPPFATITSPSAPVVSAFSSITITSTGRGTPAPTIQWEKSMDDLDYSPIAGATSSTLTLASVTMTDPWRYYRAVYTNSCRSYGSDPVFLTIIKATGRLMFFNLNHIYDGSPKRATVETSPNDFAVDITYSRNGTRVAAPIDAGRYAVTATIRDTNYAGTTTDTLVIDRAGAGITLSNLTHVHDGTAKAATATTIPRGLTVDIRYSRNGTPVTAPTEAGSYDVTATIVDSNYQGTTTGTLVIDGSTAVPGNENEIATGVTARIVPNPLGTHGEIHIEGLAPGRVQATIHDISGRPLKSIETNATGTGVHILPVDMRELPAGFYTVRIITAQGTVTLRMQVVR